MCRLTLIFCTRMFIPATPWQENAIHRYALIDHTHFTGMIAHDRAQCKKGHEITITAPLQYYATDSGYRTCGVCAAVEQIGIGWGLSIQHPLSISGKV